MKIIAQNKKALFEYEILDTLEVGIVLTGDEVKSLRAGNVSLSGSFATIHDGELYLINCHIATYTKAFSPADKEQERRRRKLLLHKKELRRLIGDVSRKGITLVPIRMYFNDRGIAKVALALAKHKKAAGKKATLKERDIRRETERELRKRY